MTEISEAKRLWIRKVQAEAFPKGVREGSLARLSPVKGSDRVLRMDGRLRYADELPYSTRCPVLLPKDHHFTQLIVLHAHRTRLRYGTHTHSITYQVLGSSRTTRCAKRCRALSRMSSKILHETRKSNDGPVAEE